jgi:T5SS/PEP-CTERM-associated repeat protein
MRERHRIMRFGRLAWQVVYFAAICFPLLFTGHLFGVTWDGSIGNWDTDASWLPGGTEPTAVDDVSIDAGTVTVDQVGEVAHLIFIGDTGTGTLTVEAGGAVSDTNGFIGYLLGSTGTVTVTGAGSTWTSNSIIVGDKGDGTLTVEAGGMVTGGGSIGVDFDSTSTVTVTGAGSTWTGNGIDVGINGDGTLTVADGGTASTSKIARIANNSDSNGTATVTGAGSTWTNSKTLLVGEFGTAALNIEDGGAVSNTIGSIGDRPGSTSTVTVTGAGSTWTNSSGLYVGGGDLEAGGTGSLSVLDSGLVEVTGTLKIWNPGSTITLNGGSIKATTIAGGTFFDFLAGTLSVESFLGTLVQDGGTLAPGISPGITTVSADYNLNAGSLEIEIGGLTAGTEHDHVDVTGTLNLGLGSTLDLSLINGFTPVIGDSFDILDWGSITGSFDTINLPALGVGLGWDTNSLLIDGTLSVIKTGPIGDLDNDGFVGIADLNIILANWNQFIPPGDPRADVGGVGGTGPDGFVGINDLNVVLGNWNAGTPPLAEASVVVPEPGSLAVLGVALMTLCGVRRHRRSAT